MNLQVTGPQRSPPAFRTVRTLQVPRARQPPHGGGRGGVRESPRGSPGVHGAPGPAARSQALGDQRSHRARSRCPQAHLLRGPQPARVPVRECSHIPDLMKLRVRGGALWALRSAERPSPSSGGPRATPLPAGPQGPSRAGPGSELPHGAHCLPGPLRPALSWGRRAVGWGSCWEDPRKPWAVSPGDDGHVWLKARFRGHVNSSAHCVPVFPQRRPVDWRKLHAVSGLSEG